MALATQGATLESALTERDQGRLFKAQRMLRELREAEPESSRLKLETAVLHLQLRDYSAADRLLTELLTSDSGLPDRVRVNVQLLQLKTRRLQHQEQRRALVLNGAAGLAYDSETEQSGLEFDGLFGAAHRYPLPASNALGYPLFTQWRNQGRLFYQNTAESESLTALVSSGLGMELANYRLSPGINYRFKQEGGEPGWYLNATWLPTPKFNLSGYLSQRWLVDEENEHSWQARLGLLGDQPIRVALSYYYRFNERGNRSATRHKLGMELLHNAAGPWVLGMIYTLDGPPGGTSHQAYLTYDHPLSRGFGLTGTLRYESSEDNESSGYSRLGIRWRK
jgi:hypothetical protein